MEQKSLILEESSLKTHITFFRSLSFVLIFIGFLVALYGISAYDIRGDKGMESFGNFSSGAVVGVWSLAGIILIYVAFLGQRLQLLYQKEELKLNRIELEETRKVLKGQEAQLEKQNETLNKQNFENTFFQLLKNYSDIIYNMDINENGNNKKGRDCFELMYRAFRNSYSGKGLPVDNYKLELINSSYMNFFNNYKNDLGNYFRNLYSIIKFVHNSEVKNKQFYTNIVRSQLSVYELVLLFYNCLSVYGTKKFKPYIERYQLVKNLPKTTLPDIKDINFYNELVFEEDENRKN